MKALFAVFLFSVSLLPSICNAQKLPQPLLSYSRLPQYPPIALATRLEGTVRVSFLLNDKGEVAEVHAVSGPKLLADRAIEDVRSWRFSLPRDLFRTDWRYETEFVYRFSGHELPTNATPKLTVSFDSFDHIEVISDTLKPIIQY